MRTAGNQSRGVEKLCEGPMGHEGTNRIGEVKFLGLPFLRVVQFWSEIIFVISNRTRAARSFDFEITRMISDQIALHSVQLPLLIVLVI